MTARAGRRPTAAQPDAEVEVILRRRAEILALPATATSLEPGLRVLTFHRGGRLAVDVEDVRDVGPARRVEPVPGQLPFLAGLVAWRGRSIPAVDPAALLGIGALEPPAHHVVLRLSRGDLVLLADQVDGVAGVPVEDLAPAPAGPAGLDRFAVGYHETIGLLLEARRLEASLLGQSPQAQEMRA